MTPGREGKGHTLGLPPYRGDLREVPPPQVTQETQDKTVTRRGTTNGNARGGSDDRRRRREWLVATYRADMDLQVLDLGGHGRAYIEVLPGTEGARPACRCYRCGLLMTADTVTVDRIKPGCRGGTYRRENIRPACGPCNSETGATTRRRR